MRRALALIPLLMLLPACNDKPATVVQVQNSKAPGDKSYRSEDGRYSVRFPKDPSISNKELATPSGVLKVQTAKVESARDLMFSVTHVTYPPSFGEVDPTKILDGVRDGLKGQDGELKSDKASTTGDDNLPTRDIRIDAGKNGIRARLILVDRRLVQVMVVGAKDSLDGKPAEEFFKSLEVTK